MYSILYFYSTSYLFNIFHLKFKKLPPVLPTQHNCSWMMDILNFNTSDHWVWWSDHNMLVQIIVVQTRLFEHDTPPFPFYRYSTFSSPSTHLHICVCACIKSYTHNFLKNVNNVPQFGMRSHRYRRAGVAAATSPDQVSLSVHSAPLCHTSCFGSYWRTSGVGVRVAPPSPVKTGSRARRQGNGIGEVAYAKILVNRQLSKYFHTRYSIRGRTNGTL